MNRYSHLEAKKVLKSMAKEGTVARNGLKDFEVGIIPAILRRHLVLSAILKLPILEEPRVGFYRKRPKSPPQRLEEVSFRKEWNL